MTADAQRLAEIEAQLAAATPGPWRVQDAGYASTTVWIGDEAIALWSREDAEFIAASPDDTRYLLGRVRALERERDRLRVVIERCRMITRVHDAELARDVDAALRKGEARAQQ